MRHELRAFCRRLTPLFSPRPPPILRLRLCFAAFSMIILIFRFSRFHYAAIFSADYAGQLPRRFQRQPFSSFSLSFSRQLRCHADTLMPFLSSHYCHAISFWLSPAFRFLPFFDIEIFAIRQHYAAEFTPFSIRHYFIIAAFRCRAYAFSAASSILPPLAFAFIDAIDTILRFAATPPLPIRAVFCRATLLFALQLISLPSPLSPTPLFSSITFRH
jgi:hypothetical protein